VDSDVPPFRTTVLVGPDPEGDVAFWVAACFLDFDALAEAGLQTCAVDPSCGLAEHGVDVGACGAGAA
jgi:hypothetical protein